ALTSSTNRPCVSISSTRYIRPRQYRKTSWLSLGNFLTPGGRAFSRTQSPTWTMLASLEQDAVEVGDVGEGRAGDEEAADPLEVARTVVARQVVGGVEAEGAAPGD